QVIRDQMRGTIRAHSATRYKRGVQTIEHLYRWLIFLDAWQWNWVLSISNGVTDHDVGDTGNRNDVACDSLFGGLTLETNGAQKLRNLHILGVLIAFFIVVNPSNLLALLDLAGMDTQKRNTTEKVRRVQVGNVCLQRRIHVGGRFWQDVVNNIEKRLQRVTLRDVCIARV